MKIIFVTGKGGGLLQKISRDDQRFAMKLSDRGYEDHGQIKHMDIMKNPIDSSKKSMGGRFHVIRDGRFYKTVKASENTEKENILKLVYENGQQFYKPTLAEARKNLIESHNSMIFNLESELQF